VDPAALAADPTRRYSPADVAAAEQIVATCPTNLKRTLRFLDAATDGATLFITCLGAPSGSVSPLLAAGPPVLGLPSRLSSTLGRLMASKKNGTPDPSEPKDTEKAERGEPAEPAEPKEAERVEAKAEPEKPAEKSEPAPSSAPAAAPAAPAKPLPAWGDAIARLEQKWVRLETMLAVGVLVCEIMSLCVWVFLKGISSPPGVSAAGVVFRAAITATVLGMAAWFGLRNQAPRFRTTATTIAVAAGLFLGRTWANVGVGYASELINWYQDASVLTLIGGLRRVGTRFTVWLAMLGASLATSSGKHINVDVVMRFLSPRVRVPAAVAAWTAASVVSMAACWGFVDHIAITAFGAKPGMSPTEKLGALAHEGAEHAFIFRRQVDLDAVVGWRVFAGRKYTQAMSGTEWNEHIKSGGYDARYTPEQVKALYVSADTQWVTPLVTIPGGKTPRALLVEDLNLLFPFGFLMIALKLLLRAMLVISGHVVVDPDAAHREDDVDEKIHEHHPEGEVL